MASPITIKQFNIKTSQLHEMLKLQDWVHIPVVGGETIS